MIPCISYWSFEHGLENTHPIDAALTEAKTAGFAGIELCIGPSGALHVETGEEECRAIRSQIDQLGMVVQTLAQWHELGVQPGQQRRGDAGKGGRAA